MSETSKEPVLSDLVFPSQPWFHFSVDDILPSLVDVSLNDIPLFNHGLMKFMKYVHEREGLFFDLYLFFQEIGYDKIVSDLKMVRDLRSELIEAGNFIRFGPHALDAYTPPFEQNTNGQIDTFNSIFDQINRFAGSNMSSSWVRLHYFAELYELGNYFREKGIDALLTTDNSQTGSFRMGEDVDQHMINRCHIRYQNTNFIRSHIRLEYILRARLSKQEIRQKIFDCIQKCGFVIIFTHEYELMRNEVKIMLLEVLDILKELGIIQYNPAFMKEV